MSHGDADSTGIDALVTQSPEDDLLFIRIEFTPEASGAMPHGRCWSADEGVETIAAMKPADEKALTGHHHLGEVAGADELVEQVDAW